MKVINKTYRKNGGCIAALATLKDMVLKLAIIKSSWQPVHLSCKKDLIENLNVCF